MGAEDTAAGWYNIRMVKHVILWKLKDEAALKGYAVHPAHVAVANAKVRPFTQTRLCLDYEV